MAETDSENLSSKDLGDKTGYEFVREIKVEKLNIDLKFHQLSVGDVGCVVWDAGIVLGKYLDNLDPSFYQLVGKSVIDIGSGTGVAGLFAAALGANVILTDLPEGIPLLEKNIRSNQNLLAGSAVASVLSWGENVEKFPSPDILLVSDCIYYDMSVEKLIPTLVTLSSNKTDLFISYEDRTSGNKKELGKKFFTELTKFFNMDIIPLREHHPTFQCFDIYLIRCKKKISQQGRGG